MREFSCTNCGSNFCFNEANKEFVYCPYCRTRYMLDDYRSTHRIIDDARIREAEVDKLIKLKQLEIAEKERKAKNVTRIILSVVFSIVLLIIIIVNAVLLISVPNSVIWVITADIWFCIIGAAFFSKFFISSSKSSENFEDIGKIQVPRSIAEYQKMNYLSAKAILERAGFLNIKLVPLNDLTIGILKRPGIIEKLTIDGQNVTGGELLYPDSPVVISYHSYPQKAK